MENVEEKMKTGGGQSICLLEEMKLLRDMHDSSGCRKALNSELWHACAGPLVSLPQLGSLVYYFPQGHIDQVAASTRHPATSQFPNYPNLPSQLMCQVLNVTLQAEKDTDEIYAQMSLQPIKMEKDVYPVPDFGLKPSKHPNEFFCKTLTASDTSTHGGFSVPRRAAEKLFPPLDYTMQPPFQELVIKDLHDNTWTFRHIYRGQPKRHLLTTGWSVFIGSKRLRAGDSVLFIRDEKSQLMIGVRRANRQQTNIPSSVLSADSMHLGVLANAAHAAANRTPFTVFYNPRACPTNFVIPASKYRKAIYGTQISSGMRFGMMFETEESSKRRYMGTIVGISDLDPLRWPGSKWRNLQVEWDEPGCCDKQNRVSAWEIETPESLFLFPSLTSGFKRPFHPSFFGGELEWGNMMKRPFTHLPNTSTGNLSYPLIPNLCPDQLMRLLPHSDSVNYPSVSAPYSSGPTLEETKAKNQAATIHRPQLVSSQNMSPYNHSQQSLNQPNQGNTLGQEPKQPIVGSETSKPEPVTKPSQINQLNDNDVKVKSDASKSIVQSNVTSKESSTTFEPQMVDVRQSDMAYLNDVLPYGDASDWLPNSCTLQDLSVFGKQDLSATISEVIDPSLSTMGQELWDQHQNLNNLRYPPIQTDQFGSYSQLSDETNNQSGIYNCIDIDGVNGGTTMVDASVSNAVLNNMGNFGSSQDLHSQITSASLADSHAFLQEFHDNSGGTSPDNVEFDDTSLLHSSWQQVVPPVRTYTKVQKAGSVGRSIDVTSFNDYEELRSAIERMFGLEGLLSDPRGSGWKLVYVDFENDVLLVGDDPWKEFVGCVRCIRILSPSEVQQMSEEGMQLLNSNAITGVSGAT